MLTPQIPQNESDRLDALLSYKVLDSHPEKDFDDITRLASEICDTPISVITLLDENRQWFKSKIGLDLEESDRETSFCGHGINNPNENMIVENALEDERFFDNPHVATDDGIRAYAGVPLVNPEGFPLGMLCVIDKRARKLDEFQIKSLEKLANQTMKLLELRKNNFKLTESHNLLAQRYKDLEQFSRVVSHDIKSPLNNIILLSKMCQEEYADRLDAGGQQMIGYIGESAEQLKILVDGILEYYKYDTIDVTEREKIRLRDFTQYIIGLLNAKNDIEFLLPDEKAKFRSNKMAFGQILYNLLANAIKYNDKPKGVIEIGFETTETGHIISVKDNGMGIPESHFDKIFDIFTTLGKTDRFNQKGTGIGLSTVQKLTVKLGGNIRLESQQGIGTTFYIHLKK
ncbi:sensor histidine kinase [Flavobacterium sp.]|uniref:sensor histidine kinase n=1 Tax=Flavobacterium sp. TaxID=239 RepID=UPI0039E38A23